MFLGLPGNVGAMRGPHDYLAVGSLCHWQGGLGKEQTLVLFSFKVVKFLFKEKQVKSDSMSKSWSSQLTHTKTDKSNTFPWMNKKNS